ncbi:hypothetical protein Oweho_1189 [Owenweeksia hongkongensis DSM 17368]|uniref:Lipid/polyisoprenoid-binding YceI-like domain-containing protein n=1 Tax=Owenweeksia hongkongensis (strain DSM 17368 / CIP 108786 / JCM 12287 / NRRL B-23963 / UST20020801) TaxID=926562 RepID=G8R604_OWEHD|nr:YceI family protein [Owenweeksia hongkongensis]AEV32194.1 hypothetical protein Oweho_1189 [Owenweeksia hongkongensis DSM 17368]
MMKHIFIWALALLSTQASFAQQTVNTASSTVKFEISNWSIKTVEGTFSGMTGIFNLNTNDLANSNFNVCIDAATINTENEQRDEHLKTDDFFDVEKYPNICFKSTSITKSDNGYTTTGTLTMHGVSKKVNIPFTYNNNTFTGTLEIDRTDFGVGSDGGFMVGEEVSLEIICVVK